MNKYLITILFLLLSVPVVSSSDMTPKNDNYYLGLGNYRLPYWSHRMLVKSKKVGLIAYEKIVVRHGITFYCAKAGPFNSYDETKTAYDKLHKKVKDLPLRIFHNKEMVKNIKTVKTVAHKSLPHKTHVL